MVGTTIERGSGNQTFFVVSIEWIQLKHLVGIPYQWIIVPLTIHYCCPKFQPKCCCKMYRNIQYFKPCCWVLITALSCVVIIMKWLYKQPWEAPQSLKLYIFLFMCHNIIINFLNYLCRLPPPSPLYNLSANANGGYTNTNTYPQTRQV